MTNRNALERCFVIPSSFVIFPPFICANLRNLRITCRRRRNDEQRFITDAGAAAG